MNGAGTANSFGLASRVLARRSKRYLSDLTDEEWSAVKPFMPKAGSMGSLRRMDLREVLNAIRYLVRSGCEWRMLDPVFALADDVLVVADGVFVRR